MQHVFNAVEVERLRERRVAWLERQHTVQAEHPQVITQMTPADDVPAPAMVNHAVGVNRSFGHVLGAPIAHPDASAVLRSGGQTQQHRRIGCSRCAAQRRERQRALDRLDPPPQPVRQDAVDLGQRTLDGRRRVDQADPPRKEQAQDQRQRLFLGEHHRRQLVARPQAVATVAAGVRFHGHAEVLKRAHIAPNGASVHLEPLGQLGAAELRTGLQEL